VLANSGFHGAELAHLPQVLFAGQARDTFQIFFNARAREVVGTVCVARTVELLAVSEPSVILHVLHFLYVGCLLSVAITHDLLHRGARSVLPAECFFDSPHVSDRNIGLRNQTGVTRSPNAHLVSYLSPHLVLLPASRCVGRSRDPVEF